MVRIRSSARHVALAVAIAAVGTCTLGTAGLGACPHPLPKKSGNTVKAACRSRNLTEPSRATRAVKLSVS